MRKHLWTLFMPSLVLVISLLVVVGAFTLWKASWITSIIFFIGAFIVLNIFIKAFFVWRSSTYILTNERVIIAEQNGWLNRSVKEANLDDILMINHTIEGFFPTMFNYGRVALNVSGATENELVLDNLYDPYGVQQVIFQAKKEVGKSVSGEKKFDTEKPIEDNENNTVGRGKEKVILR